MSGDRSLPEAHMISKESLTQPLKWHGGKHYLAKRIIPLMPPHIHYVEPYFGGGSVLLNKEADNISEVVNDIHSELTNFWRVLQSPGDFAQFQRIIEAVPFSQVEWEDSKESASDKIHRAVRFFIRCRLSRAGKFDCFATLSRNRLRRRMNEQASAWMTAVKGLPSVAARLQRVVILNDDAIEVIRREDGRRTLFYLDPPYVHDTRSATGDYQFEMSLDQHRELVEAIQQCEGKVLLSGYPNELYDRELQHWNRTDFEIDNKASSAKQKRIMTERVWMNF
jgi:DNA adenine methylase